MKLLHTADWHLNDRLGRRDRTAHLCHRVEQVAALCEEHAVDVLAVAGDVFSDRAEKDQVAESMRHLRRTFREFFQRGGTILAVTGNHDQEGRIRSLLDVARTSMEVAAPPTRRGGRFEPGRLYFIDEPFFGRVRDREGLDVQFVLFPYPTLNRLRQVVPNATMPEESHRFVAVLTAGWFRGLRDEECYDVRLRTVLIAHMTVAGADIGRGLFRLSEAQDVVIDRGDLPTGFDYVALGHIHKPQMVGTHAHVRYAGSLDRLDFSEKDDEKGVVLVEIGPQGRIGQPRVLPIEATPMIDVTIRDASVCAADLEAQVPHPERSLVRVCVEPAAAAAEATVQRALTEVLPNITSVEWQPPAVVEESSARTVVRKSSVRDTVIEYLCARIPQEDPQRAALVELAESFFSNGGAA